MANEATPVELYGQNNSGDKRRFTCASGAAIAKGTLLVMTDPRTAVAHSAATSYGLFAGIAAMDKEASDGSTTISVYTNGKFDLLANGGGAIAVGQNVKMSGQNCIAPITIASDIISGMVLGTAMEAAAAGVSETIAVKVKL